MQTETLTRRHPTEQNCAKAPLNPGNRCPKQAWPNQVWQDRMQRLTNPSARSYAVAAKIHSPQIRKQALPSRIVRKNAQAQGSPSEQASAQTPQN